MLIRKIYESKLQQIKSKKTKGNLFALIPKDISKELNLEKGLACVIDGYIVLLMGIERKEE